jgi:hypothetical protein
MKKSLLTKILVVMLAFVGLFSESYAQVTTSSMNGTIKDGRGPLPGASVKATHVSTGTVYAASTNSDGRFNISNMRVGGTYKVVVSFVGYQSQEFDNLVLKLGEPYILNLKLSEEGLTLDQVQVVGRRSALFNSKKNGASTSISKEQLESLPTLSRSLSDFYRLTPQANGNSFGGANQRYNSITIDGAVNNDVFAASSSAITPGSGANTQPISLDAIQEIQVVIAPYDITYGNFTGAGVNAVTRSGTNKVEGSAYFFGRNQGTVGKTPNGLKAADFTDYQYGLRLGGPIVKDKLFFFVNAELGRKAQPTVNNAGDPGAVLTVAQANELATFVKTKYGYDVGPSSGTDAETQNDKVFARLDWNINSKNQLMLRHNYIKAYDDVLSRSTTSFRFGNNGGRNNSEQNISVLELRSTLSESLSNNLLIGYSRIRDARSTSGQLFPHVEIRNFNSSSNIVAFGSERSSTANQLDQDIFEVTDNFKIFTGNHTFTIGTHNEFYKFRNLFVNNRFGYWQFNNLQDFQDNKPSRVEVIFPKPGNDGNARFGAAQLGFYGQDDIQVSPEFRLTAGLRIDVPVFFDQPTRNLEAETSFGYRTDITPKSKPLIAPRVGFNYDIFGDRSLQLRGGSGFFTGRVPFVWLSNQFTNNGMTTGEIRLTTQASIPNGFEPDPNKQSTVGGASNTFQLNLIDESFRLPQVFRSNLAADFKLFAGISATLEGIYSKTLNNITYKDINIKGVTGTLNPSLSGGQDLRPVYGGKVNANVTNAILLENSSKGSAYSLTAQLQKSFTNGLGASVAYTYGEAKDVNSGTSSTAVSNWQFNQIVYNPNFAPLAYSTFDTKHRIVGSLNYGIRYGKSKLFGTSLAVFYAGRSGNPFTYLYNGDLNGDGSTGNDLLYVPRSASEIKLVTIAAGTGANPTPAVTPAEQWTSLNTFIESDPYLKTMRGKYVARNGARLPWQHSFDLRLLQDIGTLIKGSSNKIQLSVDVFNIGNLINKDWGRAYFLANNASTLVSYSTSSGGGYTFRAPTSGTAYGVDQIPSRWAAQFGIRYLFN